MTISKFHRVFTIPLFGSFVRVSDWWAYSHVYHAPEKWPWWKLFSVSLLTLTDRPGTKLWRLWVYFRWNVGARPSCIKNQGVSAGWTVDISYGLR